MVYSITLSVAAIIFANLSMSTTLEKIYEKCNKIDLDD